MGQQVITKAFLLKALVSLVIIIVGITTGLFLGDLLGITGTANSVPLDLTQLSHDTYLEISQTFPDFAIDNLGGFRSNIDPLIKGKKTLICFVTNGCDPCLQLVKSISEKSILPNDSYQLILLSPDVIYFKENYSFPAYQVTWDFLESQNIIRFPTIIGVDEFQVVKFIHSGFIPQMDAKYIETYL